MTTVLDVELHVHYGFLYLLADEDDRSPDLGPDRGGQANGLLGAAVSNMLSAVTGLHTGHVPLRIDVLDSEPSVDDEWEEVVEASVELGDADCWVRSFDQSVPFTLPAPGWYRARWSASGMDEARETDVRREGEPSLDRYLLQLWLAPAAPDVIVRCTSEVATYWHGVAAETPPPPSPAEVAAAAAVRHGEEAARRTEIELEDERLEWGGALPTDALRATGPRGSELARLDRGLAERVSLLTPDAQRSLATWATALAWRDADPAAVVRLGGLDGPLRAIRRGEPLPPPFDQTGSALWDLALGPATGSSVWIGTLSEEPAPPMRVDPTAAAVDATVHAGDPDPAASAVGALIGAGWGATDAAGFLGLVLEEVDRLERGSGNGI